jgi:voltage-gated potassium channel Kch
VSDRSPGRISGARQTAKAATPSNLVERRMNKFLREPPSVRVAASVIVVATASVVVLSGIAMRIVDHTQYKNIWVGMWWAVQTVTTVGYGDVTPSKAAGRLLATVVMLEGIAFLAVITAAITSSFVARSEQERDQAADAAEKAEFRQLERRFDSLDQRLDRLETILESNHRTR